MASDSRTEISFDDKLALQTRIASFFHQVLD